MSPHFNEFTDDEPLQGLDCSVVSYSQMDAASNTRRIDAEFFSRKYLANQKMLHESSLDKLPLREITTKIDVGHVGSMTESYRENGVPLLQTQSIQEFTIDFANCVRISTATALPENAVASNECLVHWWSHRKVQS
jgi:hypothetical protein